MNTATSTHPAIDAPDLADEFRRSLAQLTSRAWVWPALIAANVAVFAAFCISNPANILEPTTLELVKWGANYGPKTTNGELWRLFTSTFMHIGVIHLLLNIAVLCQVGRLVERMTGNFGFAAAYLLAGFGGSLASVAWNPVVVSAGASGAIFGIYGVLLGFLVPGASRDSVPAEVIKQLRTSAATFIGYAISIGFTHKGIDNAAHAGGFVAGLLCGIALAHPLTAAGARSRGPRALAVLAGGLILAGGAAWSLPRGVDFDREVAVVRAVEDKTVDRFAEILQLAKDDKISDAEFADVVAKELLPPWREMQKHLHQPKVKAVFPATFMTYVDAREEYWTLVETAARNSDSALTERANAKGERVGELIKELSKGS